MAAIRRGVRTMSVFRWSVALILFITMIRPSKEQLYDCPDDWVVYDVKCYRFVLYPEYAHDAARAHCGENGASLLGINTLGEHQFVSDWLMTNDLSRREFYTSGLIRNLEEGDLVWESDGSRIPPGLQFWLSDEDRQDVGQFITYKYGVTAYGWSRAPSDTPLPFICEISTEEAYKITEEKRDFDYGLNITDPNEVPRGPKFTKEPRDVMLVTGIKSAVMDCAAFANPSPTYKMYKTMGDTGETILITPDVDTRYALTNGMLTIVNPTESLDSGQYYCEVSNTYGTVLSQTGTISFGELAEFSNVQREKVRVQEYHYGVIDCMPPNFRPAVAFGWMKSSPGNFLRTDLMLHLFPSYNGKLYFSEVGSSDAAAYFCMVKLMPFRGTEFGTDQPPARVSLPIEMEVTDSLPKMWGPEIGNDFIAVFPSQPLRGQQVRMECLAFGTMPINYKWWREGLPMPPTVEFLEENRVVVIDAAQIEDSGTYWCRASRGAAGQGGSFDEKSVRLNIAAKPYFIYELHDQHVDEGRRLTWRCEARGQPSPTYAWLKNGELLTPVPGDIEISANVLTILRPDAAKHDGMYQCRSSNGHGTVYSTGQLRVLGFAPSFAKNPVLSKTMGAVAGSVTIACSPEAAPKPTITWLRNGSPVGSTDPNARVLVLSNGNIVISQLATSDAGIYTCRAENSHGWASSDGVLQVLGRTTISQRPVNTQVIVNNTAFLACHTSHDPALDVETSWFFQGKALNWRDVHYLRGSAGGISGLYIQGAQRQHSGSYTCRAKTTFDTVVANATLSVRGPPGEPAGLTVERRTEGLQEDAVTLQWTPGATWGGVITYYTVQAATNFNDTWRIIAENIPASSTQVPNRDRLETDITNLNPFTGYRFRISARNVYGHGPYSLPTTFYQTPVAPPRRAPVNITAGEGKVGDLNITWVPIPPEEQGGRGFGYNVYYRLHGGNSDRWIKEVVGDVKAEVVLVGQEFFYTQYDVKVQAFNDAGPGPNSSVVTIYSAEDLPIGTPTNVVIYRHNATALNISWIPVPNTREYMRGKIMGYQINYWKEEADPLIMNHYTGEPADGATVIGLLADTWYRMDVQVYNAAGLGPRSEQFRQRTWKSEILVQPTEVAVMSHGPDSVYVTWRGVSPRPWEESIIGYVMQYWPSTDNVRTANGKFTGMDNFGVIYGIQKNVLYKLRIYPYSRGGDGASSPDRLFTLGGQIRYDPVTSEILAAADRPSWSLVLLLLVLLLHV